MFSTAKPATRELAKKPMQPQTASCKQFSGTYTVQTRLLFFCSLAHVPQLVTHHIAVLLTRQKHSETSIQGIWIQENASAFRGSAARKVLSLNWHSRSFAHLRGGGCLGQGRGAPGSSFRELQKDTLNAVQARADLEQAAHNNAA